MRSKIIILILICTNASAQKWHSMGAGIRAGIIRAMTIDSLNHVLYVGGTFHGVDTIYDYCRAAKWHEGVWQKIGQPCTGNPLIFGTGIYDVAFINNILYEGSDAPNCQFGYLDTLNNWQQVGGGVSEYLLSPSIVVNSIASFNGNIYCGGNFVRDSSGSGGDTVNNICFWDGSHLNSLGTIPYIGVNDIVWRMHSYNNELFINGYFSSAGPLAIPNGIARWNGNAWLSCGTNSYTFPYCYQEYNGELYSSGIYGIQKWNGSDWVMFASTGNSYAGVGAMVVYNGELIVGGGFDTIAGLPAHCIAKWNGNAWSTFSIGSGFHNTVISNPAGIITMTVMDGSLFVAGRFDFVDTISANGIVRWGPDSVLGLISPAIEPIGFFVFPNPAKEELHLSIQSRNKQPFKFTVCDLMGKVVLSGNNFLAGKKIISVKNLTNGFYFIKVYNNETFLVKKFLKSD